MKRILLLFAIAASGWAQITCFPCGGSNAGGSLAPAGSTNQLQKNGGGGMLGAIANFSHSTSGNAPGDLTESALPPHVVGTINSATNFPYAYGLVVQGNLAYVANQSGNMGAVDMAIVDVTVPTAPVVIGTLIDDTNFAGNGTSMSVSGQYAAMANLTDRVCVIDAGNPKAPATKACVIDGTNLAGINYIKWVGNFIYVGMCSGGSAPGVAVVDVSNPLAPRLRGHITDSDLPCSFFFDVQGPYLYAPQDNVTMGTSNFTILNVSNPDSITKTGTLDDDTNLAFAAQDFVIGAVAYVSVSDAMGGPSGVTAIDVHDPAHPAVISSLRSLSIGTNNNTMGLAWPYAYFPSDSVLSVVDVSNPSSMSIAASLTDATNLHGTYGVQIYGKYLYAGNSLGPPQFIVVDISGIDIPAAHIGSLQSSAIDVDSDIRAGHSIDAKGGITTGPQGLGSQGPIGGTLYRAPNCVDSAGAAACSTSPTGAFVIDAASTSTVVSTTAVTATSRIFVQEDSSLATELGVTCNTQSTLTLGALRVTARTANTSFTVTSEAAPSTNPMCVSYWIIN